MRSSSKTFVGLAGLGILVAAARAGMPLPDPSAIANEPATNVDVGPTATATPTPTATATATAKPKPGTKPKPATKPAATPTPKPTTPTTPPATGTAVSQTSAAIRYEYGTIQVKVTKDAGNITAVSYLKSSYTRLPKGTLTYLVNASIQANGSNFTKVSRATVTTDAYKNALEDALAKF